ncbi:capsular polysaccharide export protein, LipB/KpsS family [Aeromonas molluscorum]|uniref:capsular polysaccharide export protein, LipB/KpsS family n=1 Tax=Aeromonas molluscorum TaxID=271417 RepID=UPI003F19C435
MDINRLMSSFHKMETEHNLFSKMYKSEYIWDVVRFDVFHALQSDSPLFKSSGKLKIFIKKLISKSLQTICLVSLVLSRKKTLVCKTSRSKIQSGYVDPFSAPITRSLKSNTYFEIELYHLASGCFNQRYLFTYDINHSLPIVFLKEILTALQLTFPSLYREDVLIKAINNAYNKYIVEYSFYKKMYKYSSIEKTFIVQNGIQKGLLHAAIKNNVQVVELQHGYVGYTHPAYSYPRSILPTYVYTPNEFWAFSDFWHQEVYIPKTEFKILGCDFVDIKSINGNAILFISRDNHHDILVDFLSHISVNTEREIIYKLHPNQMGDFLRIKKSLSHLSNVDVILNEMSVNMCIEKSSDVVCIQSTVVFEALQSNRKVITIKRADHVHSALLEKTNNYYAIESAEEAVYIINNKKIIDDHVVFFEPINNNLILEWL